MNSIQDVSDHFNRLLISIRKQRRSTRTWYAYFVPFKRYHL